MKNIDNLNTRIYLFRPVFSTRTQSAIGTESGVKTAWFFFILVGPTLKSQENKIVDLQNMNNV